MHTEPDELDTQTSQTRITSTKWGGLAKHSQIGRLTLLGWT